MKMSLLTDDLRSHDGIEALKGINFQVDKGQIVTNWRKWSWQIYHPKSD